MITFEMRDASGAWIPAPRVFRLFTVGADPERHHLAVMRSDGLWFQWRDLPVDVRDRLAGELELSDYSADAIAKLGLALAGQLPVPGFGD